MVEETYMFGDLSELTGDQQSDDAKAYRELLARANGMGFCTVHDALDKLGLDTERE